MKRVFKYPLPYEGKVTVELPKGAEILHVAEQGGSVCLWALVDPDAPTEKKRFRFAGTGHEIVENLGKHVGTCLMSHNMLVWHVFELEE